MGWNAASEAALRPREEAALSLPDMRRARRGVEPGVHRRATRGVAD